MIDQEEQRSRLADLLSDARLARGAEARAFFGRRFDTLPDLLDLSQLTDTPDARARAKSFEKILRWHDPPITEQRHMELRDSFDFALSELQLLELAVQTGYLPVTAVRDHARMRLAELLWSGAARKYVEVYDYLAVEWLAARVDVSGLTRLIPPKVEPEGQLAFAAFYATDEDITDDADIQEWLGFLDDYIVIANEQNRFYKYLTEGKGKPHARWPSLIVGAQNHMLALADLFRPLTANRKRPFAMFYVYWLAKLLGYEREMKDYQRNTAIWGDGEDCWAATIAQHAPDPVLRTELSEAVAELRTAWSAASLIPDP